MREESGSDRGGNSYTATHLRVGDEVASEQHERHDDRHTRLYRQQPAEELVESALE